VRTKTTTVASAVVVAAAVVVVTSALPSSGCSPPPTDDALRCCGLLDGEHCHNNFAVDLAGPSIHFTSTTSTTCATSARRG
jgi:hypothetical protein